MFSSVRFRGYEPGSFYPFVYPLQSLGRIRAEAASQKRIIDPAWVCERVACAELFLRIYVYTEGRRVRQPPVCGCPINFAGLKGTTKVVPFQNGVCSRVSRSLCGGCRKTGNRREI
jgi:hypothetical protein